MEHLKRLIGPAPSEMPRPQWTQKLSALRDRVRKEMELFRQRNTTTKRKHVGKRQTGIPDLDALLYSKNITFEEFKVIAKAKKEAERNGCPAS